MLLDPTYRISLHVQEGVALGLDCEGFLLAARIDPKRDTLCVTIGTLRQHQVADASIEAFDRFALPE